MTAQPTFWEASARGQTFDVARYGERIHNALQRIYHHLKDGHVCSLSEMASEFYIVANSFAAPFFSDTSTKFVKAATPTEALEQFATEYKHPCGLYAAACYRDANAEANHEPALARWLSNHAAALEKLTPKGGYRYLGHGPGDFELDGTRQSVNDPKAGAVYA